MGRDVGRVGIGRLVRGGLRRSPLQTLAGLLAAFVAAGSLVAAIALFAGMGRLLDEGLERLGPEVVLTLPAHESAVKAWLESGSAPGPVPAQVPVAQWRQQLQDGKVLGLVGTRGWSLADGGEGRPTDEMASALLVQLEFWVSPMMAQLEIAEAIPGVAIVVAEQPTRHVLRDLQPLVRHLMTAAGVALVAAVLLGGLLAAIRVGERRAELGMLRAVGATRSFLVALTLSESLLLALLGGLAGIFAVSGLAWLMPPARQILRLLSLADLVLLVLGSLLVTLVATGLAALLPALRAGALDPLEAARRHR